MENPQEHTEIAILAGGCFWCLEAVFNRLKGVLSVQSGYTGGQTPNPSYKDVCSGQTGHAEAIRIAFDKRECSYHTLLSVFFSMHDPTTLNRQGADIGSQYRSAIFYTNPEQYAEAKAFIQGLSADHIFNAPVVTELSPAGVYYPAEQYHNNYYDLNREQNSYCTAVIDPKVNKLRKSYAHLLKS